MNIIDAVGGEKTLVTSVDRQSSSHKKRIEMPRKQKKIFKIRLHSECVLGDVWSFSEICGRGQI